MARSPKSGLFDMGLDENGVAAFHPSLRNDDPLMLTLDDGSKVNTTGIVELAGRPDNLYILASRLGEIVLRPGYDPQRFPDMAVVDPGDMRDMIWHIHNSLYNRMHEFEPDDRMAECVTY
jgi:hypothetical protein